MGILSSIGRVFAQTYWREKPIIDLLHPFLADVGEVLDIGAGGCQIAHLISVTHQVDVTAVDIVDHRVTDVPLTLYDGETLPFDDNSFDVSLLIFVLHHAVDPERLIREALRVTRSTLLIVEDAPKNVVEKVFWRSWDYLLNHGAHNDISIAHDARGTKEWSDLLAAAGAPAERVLSFRTLFPVLRTYPHVLLPVPVHRSTGA